jgi:hypothetical protein
MREGVLCPFTHRKRSFFFLHGDGGWEDVCVDHDALSPSHNQKSVVKLNTPPPTTPGRFWNKYKPSSSSNMYLPAPPHKRGCDSFFDASIQQTTPDRCIASAPPPPPPPHPQHMLNLEEVGRQWVESSVVEQTVLRLGVCRVEAQCR